MSLKEMYLQPELGTELSRLLSQHYPIVSLVFIQTVQLLQILSGRYLVLCQNSNTESQIQLQTHFQNYDFLFFKMENK